MGDLIDKAEALAVLRKAQVASCTCQIKTPDPEWHSHNCRYRILRDAEAMIDHLPDAALPPAKQDNVAISNARGVGVQDARDALEELANMPLGIPLEDWARLSARILAALEPVPTDAAQARVIRNGEHLFNTAKSLGWADDGEGALEFVMRRTREVALEDAAQEREAAWREVAELVRGWRNDVPMTGEECANAILALIGDNKHE